MPTPKAVPPLPRKRMPRAEREQQMIEVALNLFVSAGYQGTSIEHIAAAAGVSRPILYNLFGSKDKIYLACLKRARECLNNRLIEAVGSASSFQDRLRAGMDGYFQFVEQNRAAWRLLFAGERLWLDRPPRKPSTCGLIRWERLRTCSARSCQASRSLPWRSTRMRCRARQNKSQSGGSKTNMQAAKRS